MLKKKMYSMFLKTPLLFVGFAVFMTSGCSVYKAASNDGVAVRDIKTAKYKSALLSKGMERIDSVENKDGTITETYKAVARKSGANYVRAAGHGALDVMTLGLWEVVGTPVEGAISNNRRFIIAKATYANKASDDIQKLSIYDDSGNPVK